MRSDAQEKQFEITKHFASVIRMHFGWVSCHVIEDGEAIIYRTVDGGPYRMSGARVLSAGAAIELAQAEQDKKTFA